MNRRAFIRGALVLLPAAAMAAKPAPTATPRRLVMNRFHVAGFQFHAGLRSVAELRAGVVLRLAAEPDNPYDHCTVGIFDGDRKLGYIPRTENKHVSRLLRQGAPVECRVLEVRPEDETWRMVKVETAILA